MVFLIKNQLYHILSYTGDVCVVITNSDTNKNGELEVTFFAALDSGNGVLQHTSLQAAIQVRDSCWLAQFNVH